ncbi:MAG: acyl-CoA dehydrogenase [Endozoicomonadaceae bacterium]|nr:acyl-CoA dehydrogenase [Endozoicomonadaceae bacterium]
MGAYKAPLKDMQFVLNELLDYSTHYNSFARGQEATAEIVLAMMEEAARFAETVLAPLNAIGDEQGCTLIDQQVKTPDGFKVAYAQFIENGWPALSHEPKWGGQGLPESLSAIVNEMFAEANWAWDMYPGLSHGALSTLIRHGNDEQKATYLPALVSGKWTGTMCLTESHCGSDLGLLKTKAIPHADGHYRIQGSKIFISSGDHDLSENIVHIVLARLPDAPHGTKGISLFIVPKFIPTSSGEIGVRNEVYCGSLEKKMGIHGNATCVMNFEDAIGYLIGEANRGLSYMFTFMNFARMGTALQGLAHSEIAWQKAYDYTQMRQQGRDLNVIEQTDSSPRVLIKHPDVLRMLLTIKAFTEGNRALYYYVLQQADRVLYFKDKQSIEDSHQLMELLTPICKAFMTETGLESANLGMQCFGGHGYISEYGMEQNVRDARISTIYEGTTYIQSLDLLGRKILMTQGNTLRCFTKIIHQFCKKHEQHLVITQWVKQLRILNKNWGNWALEIGIKALTDREEVGAAAYDFMMISGYICLAWVWADMARIASDQLSKGHTDTVFYQQKIDTASFYYDRILPRIEMHQKSMHSGLHTIQLTRS